MRLILCIVAAGLVAAGCGRGRGPMETAAADRIAWANEQIDAQRVIKRQLLVADPIEREVERRLNGDERVESARFAILIPHYGWMGGVSLDGPLTFSAVVSTHEAMTEAEALELLESACLAAGMAARPGYHGIVRDGRTFGVTWGRVHPREEENPDLSVLRGE